MYEAFIPAINQSYNLFSASYRVFRGDKLKEDSDLLIFKCKGGVIQDLCDSEEAVRDFYAVSRRITQMRLICKCTAVICSSVDQKRSVSYQYIGNYV